MPYTRENTSNTIEDKNAKSELISVVVLDTKHRDQTLTMSNNQYTFFLKKENIPTLNVHRTVKTRTEVFRHEYANRYTLHQLFRPYVTKCSNKNKR